LQEEQPLYFFSAHHHFCSWKRFVSENLLLGTHPFELRKCWQFWRNFGLALFFISPPTQQFFAIFVEVLLGGVFLCPLQLSNFWRFSRNFSLAHFFTSPPTQQFLGILRKFC
jgi:hypothetical protein